MYRTTIRPQNQSVSTVKNMLLSVLVLALVLPLQSAAQEESAGKDDPVTRKELEETRDALQGLNESFAEYRGFVDVLRKIKISGYIQSQYRSTDLVATPYSVGGFSGGAFPTNSKGLFQIRRGRFKVTYDNVLTQYVLQIDAIPTGVSLKDAYVAITEPWTKSFGLQMGVFDRPFGYEISYSSSSRETPERSRLFQTLFPGERGTGAKLFYAPQLGPLSMLRADVGIFNGSGPSALEFDNFKDLIGHVAYQIPFDDIGAALDLGVSGYLGSTRSSSRYIYETGTLANGTPGYGVDSASTNVSRGMNREYIGFDAQFYYDLPLLGGTILRGEYITGTQPGLAGSSTSISALPTTPIYSRKFAGWYAYLIQNIGPANQLVLKYDVYDPNTAVAASDFSASNTSGATGLSATDIRFSTLGLGWIYHWDDNVKFVLYYEMVSNEKLTNLAGTSSSLSIYSDDVRDNVLTFRTQVKF